MTSEGPLLSAPGDASDRELWDLLSAVYVAGGFTKPELAKTVFAPEAVRARGAIITARERLSGALIGMIILVPPGGAARQVACDAEAEVHLLAVHPVARKGGVGRALIAELLGLAAERGSQQLVLSTQDSMQAAHSLYESTGFTRLPERDWERAGRRFLAYRREVSLPTL
ncbi:MAG: GNAT family N-acetyltransferase [Polyangiaceae bacterium]